MEKNFSLLYVEDDPQARELVERLITLKFPDITLHTAMDGEEGLGLYVKHRPDLVVTDISMPVLDGFEMSKRIRSLNPDAFIIALTALRERIYTSSEELRFNQIVEKPVEVKVLVDGIRDAVVKLLAAPQS